MSDRPIPWARRLRRAAVRLPWVGAAGERLWYASQNTLFRRRGGSSEYWENRYADGGTSGDGSVGRLARFKAEFLNAFVRDHGVRSVVEFGCGDGDQLALAEYPRYLGLDVSKNAVARCISRYRSDATKSFLHADPRYVLDHAGVLRSDLTMSLDVIYHLTEDGAYEAYMRLLFESAERFVIIYSSNKESSDVASAHVRHREFGSWVETYQPAFRLASHTPNRYPPGTPGGSTSDADFFVYARAGAAG